MTQLSLFDASPIHRVADKQTSADAAKATEPKLGGLRLEFVNRLRSLGMPATAQEISGGNESLRKRALECVRLGFIVEVGTKKCAATGKSATAYWVANEMLEQ